MDIGCDILLRHSGLLITSELDLFSGMATDTILDLICPIEQIRGGTGIRSESQVSAFA